MKTTIEFAREAAGDDWDLFREFMPEIHKLAELVRLDEREVCAYKAGIAVLGADRGLANRVDQAIRARSNT
jgi:hypothetical protein